MSDILVHSVQNSNKKELFLDTKGVCFLCLNENHEENNGLVETSLRNICRFLDIGQSSVLLNGLEENHLADKDPQVKRDNYDFTTILCSTCSSLTTNLSDMIHQMELIKMLSMHQLQVFHQIISTSNRESSPQWKHLLGKLMKSSNPVEASLVESLRNEAAIKSLKKVIAMKASGHPKVVLSKIDVSKAKGVSKASSNMDRKPLAFEENDKVPLKERLSNDQEIVSSHQLPQSQSSMKKRWTCKLKDGGCGKRFSRKSKLKKHIVLKCSNRKNKPTGPTVSKSLSPQVTQKTANLTGNHVGTDKLSPESSSSQQKILKKYCGQETIATEKGTQTNYWCRICKSVKKSSAITNFHMHLVSIHSEKFFSGKRLSALSEDQFKLCCRNALHLEAKQAERLPGKKIYEGAAICSHCGIKMSNLRQIRYHLMLEHLDILERKMMILQENMKSSNENFSPPVTSQKQESSTTVYHASPAIDLSTPHISNMLAMHSEFLENGTYQCLLCSTCGVKRDLQIHLVNMHPEKIFASEMVPEFPVEQFKSCCRQLLANKSQGKSQKPEHGTFEKPVRTEVSCYICGLKRSNFKLLKYHMVLQHYDVLGQSLRQFQENALLHN